MTWLSALRDRANGMPIVALLSLALFLAVGSHRLQTDTDDPALQAYLDASGSLAQICGLVDTDAYPVNGCPLCVLAHCAVLPQTDFAFQRAPGTFHRLVPVPRLAVLHPAHGTERHGIHAPPSPADFAFT